MGSEIILRPNQVCNLTEVVVRSEDTLANLAEKVELATILGTVQSMLTNFRYLGKKWQKNTEEERLLGVSLTGIMDHPIMSGNTLRGSFENGMFLKEALEYLRQVAVDTNKIWAEQLEIEQSAAITCVKPSGTVSQLVNSSSGIHARHSKFYIRTVRVDKKDPIYPFLKEQGIPVEDAFGKEQSTAVFSFPVASPDDATTRNDMTAIEQLELWKIYAEHWCEHKPSVTISVREHEWMEVGAWVYRNFDICSGVSFLPHTDHVYKQAPYQDITEEEYKEFVNKIPAIDWSKLSEYETEDNTTTDHELACSAGGSCEIL